MKYLWLFHFQCYNSIKIIMTVLFVWMLLIRSEQENKQQILCGKWMRFTECRPDPTISASPVHTFVSVSIFNIIWLTIEIQLRTESIIKNAMMSSWLAPMYAWNAWYGCILWRWTPCDDSGVFCILLLTKSKQHHKPIRELRSNKSEWLFLLVDGSMEQQKTNINDNPSTIKRII